LFIELLGRDSLLGPASSLILTDRQVARRKLRRHHAAEQQSEEKAKYDYQLQR
jgi:hypothetical protein